MDAQQKLFDEMQEHIDSGCPGCLYCPPFDRSVVDKDLPLWLVATHQSEREGVQQERMEGIAFRYRLKVRGRKPIMLAAKHFEHCECPKCSPHPEKCWCVSCREDAKKERSRGKPEDLRGK